MGAPVVLYCSGISFLRHHWILIPHAKRLKYLQKNYGQTGNSANMTPPAFTNRTTHFFQKGLFENVYKSIKGIQYLVETDKCTLGYKLWTLKYYNTNIIAFI